MRTAISGGISIARLVDHNMLDAAVQLEQQIWGYSELDTDSRAILVIAERFIGQLFGAFDNETLIGIALAFHTPNPRYLHSHRVGVLPAYQNRGIGFQLKMAQRSDALTRGIETIQWTFDPLQSRNAYFNIARLGGIARKYIRNIYGQTSSPLHGSLPTDRLLIEWPIASERVEDALAGRAPQHARETVRLPLPPREHRREAAMQEKLRDGLEDRFAQGFSVTGFESALEEDVYILEQL